MFDRKPEFSCKLQSPGSLELVYTSSHLHALTAVATQRRFARTSLNGLWSIYTSSVRLKAGLLGVGTSAVRHVAPFDGLLDGL